MSRWIVPLLGLALVVNTLASAVQADEDPDQKSPPQVRQLREMAERFAEQGNLDVAARIREQAKQVEQRLLQMSDRERISHEQTEHAQAVLRERIARHQEESQEESKERSAEAHPEQDRPVARLRHLRVAAENLQAAGMHEQAADLLHQAERMEREIREHAQHRPEQPRPEQVHLEAMKVLENMAREQRELHEQVAALRKEVAMLRETLLRLPPPALSRPISPPPMGGDPIPGPVRPPTPRELFSEAPFAGEMLQRKAETLFKILDRDSDGSVSGKEWERHPPTRKMFENLDVDIDEPVSMEKFVKIYVKSSRGDHKPEADADDDREDDGKEDDEDDEKDSKEPRKRPRELD